MPSTEHEQVYHAATRCQAASLPLTARRLHDLLIGGIGAGQPDVVDERRVEQVRVLGDQGDEPTQLVELELANVAAADGDAAALRVPEAQHQVRRGGFASTGTPAMRETAAFSHSPQLGKLNALM